MNFNIGKGQLITILGPNGAGKSTTIKSIIGLLKYEGEIAICGYKNTTVEAKSRFGYIPEVPVLYDLLTIDEHIAFIAHAHGIADYQETADRYLALFELTEKRNKMAKELSKGMRQKLSMILALVTKPEALLIDEPMIGLDPQSIENVLKLLVELKESGVSILISTHIIDIIADIWDTAYIMKKGQVVHVAHKAEMHGNSLKDVFFALENGVDPDAQVEEETINANDL